MANNDLDFYLIRYDEALFRVDELQADLKLAKRRLKSALADLQEVRRAMTPKELE